MNLKGELIGAAAPLAAKSVFAFGILATVSIAAGIVLADSGATGVWKLVEATADGVAGVSFGITAIALALWLAHWLPGREARKSSDAMDDMKGREIDIRRLMSQGIMAGMVKAVPIFSAVLLVSLLLPSLLGDSFRWGRFVEPLAAGMSIVSAVLVVVAGAFLLVSWVQLHERQTPSNG